MTSVSVVIPARNEASNLLHVLPWISPEYEVIIVDGHSTDDTKEVVTLVRPRAIFLKQSGKGKGNALAQGFAVATGDIIIMLDADGSAHPQEIPAFVAALEGGADFAKGTRFGKGGGSDDISLYRMMGNRMLNFIVHLLFGTKYTDLCYGYNAFWSHNVLPVINLSTNKDIGFEIETMINVRVAKHNLKITEVGSFEYPRIHGHSHLHPIRDGLRVLRVILKEYFDIKDSQVYTKNTALGRG